MSQCEGGLSLAILIRVIATQSKATTQILLYIDALLSHTESEFMWLKGSLNYDLFVIYKPSCMNFVGSMASHNIDLAFHGFNYTRYHT